MTAPTLTGRRVLLRALDEADRSRLREILAEPAVARWWGTEPPAAAADDLFKPYHTAWAIVVDGLVVGSIQVYEETDPDYRHAGIDLFIAASHQRMGLGPEAIRLVAGHLFDVLGHHRLTIDPAAANASAIRAYERVGFSPVGVMRRYERGRDLAWHDNLLMDMLEGELR